MAPGRGQVCRARGPGLSGRGGRPVPGGRGDGRGARRRGSVSRSRVPAGRAQHRHRLRARDRRAYGTAGRPSPRPLPAAGRHRAGPPGTRLRARRRLRRRRQVGRAALGRGVRPTRLGGRLHPVPPATGRPGHDRHPGSGLRRATGCALGLTRGSRLPSRHQPDRGRRLFGRGHHRPVPGVHGAGEGPRRRRFDRGRGHGPVGRPLRPGGGDHDRRAATRHRPRHEGHGRTLRARRGAAR